MVWGLARSAAAADAVAAAGAQPVPGDVSRPGDLPGLFESAGCDTLLSLVSLGFGHGPGIVAAAERAGIRRAVFVSTTAVTTRLAPPTRRIRLAAEDSVRACSLDWTLLRPTMIYGAPGDRNMSLLLSVLTRAWALPVPGARYLHQPVHVADLASAVRTAAQCPAAVARRYDVAGPEPVTFAELLRQAAMAVGSTTRFVPVPLAPVAAAARLHERFSQAPRIKTEQILRLGENKAFRIDDAQRDLGYAPRPFAEGIRAEARALGLAA
jgi:nucleoside-diphosphate-sugar epimerase